MLVNINLKKILGSSTLWPVLLGSILVLALVHYLLILSPESPKFLFVYENKLEETRYGIIFNNMFALISK